MKTYIIAEAGVNHNGQIILAKKLIDEAVKIGSDAIKFQFFDSSQLASAGTKKASYQIKNSKKHQTQLQMLKGLELSSNEIIDLKEYSKKKKIDFLLSCFDLNSLNFVLKKLNPKVLKIASGEINNYPLLIHHALSKKKIILSTGMSNISEIRNALGVIAFGYLNSSRVKPSNVKFEKTFKSSKGKEILRKNVTLLQCTSDYPCSYKDSNLLAINNLREIFGLKIGYSDHTSGIEASISAVSLGASVIEKHLTLDNSMRGPDHKASLNPKNFNAMVNSIRNIEIALGDGNKRLMPSEKANLSPSRKSLCANKEIRKNEIFTLNNLTTKRPGNGISPTKYWNYIGKRSKRNYKKDALISE